MLRRQALKMLQRSLVLMSVWCQMVSEADVCPGHRLHDPISNTTYTLPDTPIGQLFISRQECLATTPVILWADGRPFVILECYSGTSGAQWGEFMPNRACNYTDGATSPRTPVIRRLLSSMMTLEEEASANPILNTTLELLLKEHTQQTLSALDVVFLTDIVQLSVDRPNVSVQDADIIVKIVDALVAVDDDVLQESRLVGNATNRLLLSLERFGDKVVLNQQTGNNNNQSLRLLASSFAYEVWDLTQRAGEGQPLVIGLEKRVPVPGVEGHVVRSHDLFTVFEDEGDLDFNRTDVAIVLPVAFLRNVTEGNPGQDIRLSLGVFADTSLFGNGTLESRNPKTSDRFYQLNSRVVSARVTVNGEALTDLGGYNVTTVFLPWNQTQSERRWHVQHTRCVFWNFGGDGGLAAWSDEGCTSQDADHGRDVCQFDHLTNFAVLMDVYGQGDLPEEHQSALSVISIIGLSLSMAGLSCTVFAFLRISKLRQGRRQKVLFNLSLAMLLSWAVFLAGFTKRVHGQGLGHAAIGCLVVAVLLHYLVLASFLWMLMEGVLQHLLFVKVFNAFCANYVAKTVVLAWGLPLVPVITVLCIDPHLYEGGDQYCWMSLQPFYYAFLLPVAVILLANAVIYVLVVIHICRCRGGLSLAAAGGGHTAAANRRAAGVRASLACFVVLGFSWMFAFLAVGDSRVVFQYLFTVTTTLQGFLIFIVFTARDASVRGLLLRRLTRRSKTGSSTSSSGRGSSTAITAMSTADTARIKSSLSTL